MNNNNQERAKEYVKEHTRKKRWQKVMITMASVVVFWVTYSLIIPGISWERTLICEKKEHKHTDACYEIIETEDERVLSCDKNEHKHGESCYEEKKTLVCDKEEHEGHKHGDSCYKTEKTLICGQEEDPDHIHDDSCYKEERVLVCDKKETEGHKHGDSCYKTEKVLVCHEDEHVHDDSCYTVNTGGKKKVLICDKEEHEHTDSCYDAPPASDPGYYCGKIAHKHTKECYFDNGTLRCTIEEHEHTDACKINPEADTETASTWEHTMSGVKLTGKWCDDLIVIAKTQLGYKESTDNYILNDAGKKKGYSRYGAWYGDPYGDWCAMFVSFCLNYANVDRNAFPQEANCQRWIELLKKDKYDINDASAYRTADQYTPVPGDIIFFDWGGDGEDLENGSADHVGIVEEVKYNEDGKSIREIRTIEGNAGNMVQERTYEPNDRCILGYGVLPENPNYDEYKISDHTITSEAAEDGAVVKITGALPAEAVAIITLNKELTEDDYVDYFEEDLAKKIDTAVSYDIKIMVKDEEWQPNDTVRVDIIKPAITIEDERHFGVLHIDEAAENVVEDATKVEATVKKNGNIEFDTDSFSEYVLYTYTVDFHNGDLVFSIGPGQSILLSELFVQLGIDRDVADVVNVYFSNPEYLAVEKTQDDWKLTALKAFDTEETLTIEFNDGEIYVIRVTDAQMTLWQKVDSIVPGETYLIVCDDYALNTNNSNLQKKHFVPHEDPDKPNYYYVDAADTEKWIISGGTNSNYTVKNGNTYLGIYDYLFYNSSRNVHIAGSNGKWKISYSYNSYGTKTNYLRIVDNREQVYDYDSNTTTWKDTKVYGYNRNNPSQNNITLYKAVEYDDGYDPDPYEPGPEPELILKEPKHSKQIDAFRDGTDNTDTDLDDEASDLTDLYRLYLNVGPADSCEPVDVLFVVDVSTSMIRNEDATDLLGAGGQTRMHALNSLLNGQKTAGVNNSSVLYPNGLIKSILAMNSNNRIAVTAFSTREHNVFGWSTSGQAVNGDYLNTLDEYHDDIYGYGRQGATNYVAGLQNAKSLLDSSFSSSNNKKIMIFISDGNPTYHYNGLDDTVRNLGGHGNITQDDTDYWTTVAIHQFKEDYESHIDNDLFIYSIAVGSNTGSEAITSKYLTQLSTNHSTIYGRDFSEMFNQIEYMVTKGHGHYSHLQITDRLSEYVDYYQDDPDLIVKRITTTNGNNTEQILYQNGNRTETGTTYLADTDPVVVNGKTVTVTFKDTIELEQNVTYQVSFNIKATQTAYDTYVDNIIAAEEDGYAGVKGDEYTDYKSNQTSSEQPGFYANSQATINEDGTQVTAPGTVLRYAQEPAITSTYTDRFALYDKPVIQVSKTDAIVNKVWADGNENHTGENESVKVGLFRKKKTDEKSPENDKVAEAELTAPNWTHTFTDLVVDVDHQYEYYVQEIDCSISGYVSSEPVYNTETNTWTITNSPTSASITVQKVDMNRNPITYEGATFDIYSDEDLENKINEDGYVTDENGQFTISDLEIGNGTSYWIVETNPPEGYTLLQGAHKFTVSYDSDYNPVITTATEDQFLYVSDPDEDDHVYLCFINSTGQELPGTGGTGTAILYILGGALLAFALICGFILRCRQERRAG